MGAAYWHMNIIKTIIPLMGHKHDNKNSKPPTLLERKNINMTYNNEKSFPFSIASILNCAQDKV